MILKHSKAFGPVVLLFVQYMTKVMTPLISILLVRYLGVEDYGYYASAIAVTSFLTFLPDFGLQQAALKLSVDTKVKLNVLIKSTLYTSLLYTFITFVFLMAWLNIFNYQFTIKLVAYILAISFIRLALLKVMTTLLQIRREFTRIAVWNLLINSIQWIVTLICMFFNSDLFLLVFWPQFISLLITLLMLIVEGKRVDLYIPNKHKGDYKTLIISSVEFGTANSMYQMYHRSDAMILSATRSHIEVGFFNVAFKIAELIYFFAGVLFNQVLYPMFFKWSKYDRNKYLRFYRLLNKLMLIFGSLSASIVLLFSKEIIYVIFGREEELSSNLLSVMMLAVPIRFLVVSIGAILTTDNLVRKRIKIQSMVAIFNIALNALLIPVYGAIVAAVIMVLTDLFLLICYLAATNKNITNKHFSKKNYYQLPVFLIILVFMFYFSPLNFSIKIIIGVIVVFISLLIGGLSLEKEELIEIKMIFKLKNN